MKKISSLIVVFSCSLLAIGQSDGYKYNRAISGIENEWNQIQIPLDAYAKIRSSLSDVRIFGVTSTKDTVEAPYVTRVKRRIVTNEKIQYELINKSRDNKGFYYTFKVPSKKVINNINLDFSRDNFDWKIRLEGSQNQSSWKTIIEDYRIISINNSNMSYSYTNLDIPSSNFSYYRLFVPDEEDPQIIHPEIKYSTVVEGEVMKYKVVSRKAKVDKKRKATVIEFELEYEVPVNQIKVSIDSDVDYYRNVEIEYLYDSTKTAKGYRYNYSYITHGMLSSMSSNQFQFSEITCKRFRLTIRNEDNAPLNVGKIEFSGNIHVLIARFDHDADYFLAYGNPRVSHPNYDIEHFLNKIPDQLDNLILGPEKYVSPLKKETQEEEKVEEEPLFISRIWIWVIMGIVILLLGTFTFKMMKSEENNNIEQ